jgi:ribosome-associated toxin RatA of RatAB toxin-antitoxin module
MTQLVRTALVAYSASELLAMVEDVEAYPQYLPWCVDARVLQRDDEFVTAHIAFSRAGIRQGVTTRNRRVSTQRLEMELVEGPFAELRGAWDFRALAPQASKVTFTIDYEIDSSLAHLAATALVNESALIAIDAFQKRAAQLYGKRF